MSQSRQNVTYPDKLFLFATSHWCGCVPWDTEVDILIDASTRGMIQRLLEGGDPNMCGAREINNANMIEVMTIILLFD